MTVHVDQLIDYGDTARARGLPHTHWCHLTADTRDELHAFAARIGLRRAWFQDHEIGWHYDITPNKRAQALRLGAVELPAGGPGRLMMARRDELRRQAETTNLPASTPAVGENPRAATEDQ